MKQAGAWLALQRYFDGAAVGSGTGSLNHPRASSYPVAGKDEPQRWLILFCQHIIVFFRLLTGHTMQEITDTCDAVSEPMLWF